MLARWCFLELKELLGFPESQTWPHQPIYVIIAIVSYLICTSDSHLSMKVSPLTHTLLYIIQHSVIEGQVLPPCIMDQRKTRLLAANLALFFYLHTHTLQPRPHAQHTHTHTHDSLTERLVWSDSNVILIARGDDSLSPLCWYPQAWQSFGHTSHCCTSANTGTISPLCLFQSLSLSVI